MKEVYLDYAAASPVRPEVVEAMTPYFSQQFANPSSIHNAGQNVRTAIETARTTVARILNCFPDEIIFTSGGTESINLAIKGIARANKQKGNHIITSKIEHEAVLQSCKQLEHEGFEVTYLPVDKYGIISPKDVEAVIRPTTILISIMYANNEVGTIQSISELGTMTRKHNLLFHTDACQAGSLDLNIENLQVDVLTLNGSKIYGPKGVGLLYVKRGTAIQPLLHGGGQEAQLRSGSENTPAIVGFAKALVLAQQEKEQENAQLTLLRNKLVQGVVETIPDAILNGHSTHRLANNVNLSFKNVEGESLLLYLNEFGIYASSGSACTSHAITISHVLQAMGVPDAIAQGTIRFTLGKYTTEEDIQYVLEVLPTIIAALRKTQEVVN